MRIPSDRLGAASRRATVLALAVVAGSVVARPVDAGAQLANTCVAGKIKCTNVFASSVFKCVAAAYKKPPTFESEQKAQDCIRKARQKFGTAVSPKPGCIDKIEAKEDPAKSETVCPLGADEFGLDDIVKFFTEDLQDDIAPIGPSPFGSSCDAGKFKCVGTKFKVLLGCHAKAFKKGVVVDPVCVAKAVDKFNGSPDPSKGCFEKLEAKQKITKLKSLCGSDDNIAVVGGKTLEFVDDVVGGITH
jgi:hypothetical protein